MKKDCPFNGLNQSHIDQLLEILKQGLMESPIFVNCQTVDFDWFIKRVGSDWRNAGVSLLERRLDDFIHCVSITVDYDEPEAMAKAITAAKFDGQYVGLRPMEIPLIGSGRKTLEAHEVRFGRKMYDRDLPRELDGYGKQLGFSRGFKFADPLTALRAAANQNLPRLGFWAILFNDNRGRPWSLRLIKKSGKRFLRVDDRIPDGNWYEDANFLAVEKLPLEA
jgi:hypothetical protein